MLQSSEGRWRWFPNSIGVYLHINKYIKEVEQMHVELFQVRKKLCPLSRECRLELTPPGEWIIPATKSGSLWLTVLVKQISSHSLTSQEKLAPKNKRGCGGDVSPFCHFYWVSCNIMDNVIAGFSSQSSQSQSVLKKTHQNKSIVFKRGGTSHFRLMLYIMSPL